MQYLSHIPRPPLNAFVERLWMCIDGQSPRKERILPSGTIELVVNLRDDEVRIHDAVAPNRVSRYSGIVASGAYSSAFVIDAMQHAAMIGVHFRPGGAPAILGLPASELTNAHLDVAAFWGERPALELRERLCATPTAHERFRLMEGALIARLRSPGRHPMVLAALEAFGGAGVGSSIRDAARSVGLSQRRFITIFATDVGLTPKRFCRILRFQHVHALTRRPGRVEWAQLALECGYFDQSHLSNEVREISGLSPTEYLHHLRRETDLLVNHVALG